MASRGAGSAAGRAGRGGPVAGGPGVGGAAARGSRLFMVSSPQGLVCPPTVWVDGQRLDVQSEAEGDGAIDIDFWIDPTRLAGIEVYTRANEAPLQYGGTNKAACGVVVIWHRVRPSPRTP